MGRKGLHGREAERVLQVVLAYHEAWTAKDTTPQALPRPPPLPTTATTATAHDLTRHRSIIRERWRIRVSRYASDFGFCLRSIFSPVMGWRMSPVKRSHA